MKQKFKEKQIVYMIASANQIKEMVVVRYSGGFYTLRYRFTDGGIRVRESRLYATKEEAEKNLKATPMQIRQKQESERNMYDQATEKYYT